MLAELVALGEQLNGIWLNGFRDARRQFQIRGLSQDGDEVLSHAYELVKMELTKIELEVE